MNSELEKLHNWIDEKSENYISMIAIGSIAVDDKFIPGRSDYDILLIFSEINNSDINTLESYLSSSNFTDEYLFVPMAKDYYIRSKGISHDLSGKFRSKTLFGQDIISEKQIPSRKEMYEIYSQGLDKEVTSINNRIHNSTFWSNEKVQTIVYKFLKHTFMYLSIKQLYDTDKYPTNRRALVDSLNSSELSDALNCLENINDKNKEELTTTVRNLLNYLEVL